MKINIILKAKNNMDNFIYFNYNIVFIYYIYINKYNN
jgi:hypothetical protein